MSTRLMGVNTVPVCGMSCCALVHYRTIVSCVHFYSNLFLRMLWPYKHPLHYNSVAYVGLGTITHSAAALCMIVARFEITNLRAQPFNLLQWVANPRELVQPLLGRSQHFLS